MTDLLENYSPPSRPSGRERVDYMARLADISRMTDQGPSVGGFARNAYKDVAEMVHGIGALPSLAVDVVTEPGKTLPAIGRGLIDWYAEALKHPGKYVYEHPVSALTDLLTLWSAGAGAVGKVGDVAKIGALSKVAELKPGLMAERLAGAAAGKYLPIAEEAARGGGEMPQLTLLQRGARDLTKFLQGREATRLTNKASRDLFLRRQAADIQMAKIIGGRLAPEEASKIAWVAEHSKAFAGTPLDELRMAVPEASYFATYPGDPAKIAQEFAPGTRLRSALDYSRERGFYLADIETKLPNAPYSEKAAELRPWEPEAFGLLEKRGLTPEELGQVQKRLGTLGVPQGLADAVVQRQGISPEVYNAWTRRDRLEVVTAIADTLKKEAGGRPINLAYYPHITPEAEPTVTARLFLKKWPLEYRTPSYGREFAAGKEFSHNFDRSWSIRNAESAKAELDGKIAMQVAEKFGLPWNGSPSGLLPGYVIMATDNWINYKRMIMNISDDYRASIVAKGGGTKDLLSAAFPNAELADIVRTHADDLIRHGKIRLSKGMPISQGLVQVPKTVKRALESSFVSKFSPTLKLFWDSPMNFWRSMVLAYSPRWLLYNTVGNIVLSTLAGVSPADYYRAIKFGKHIPEEIKMGFFPAEEFVAHVGGAKQESMFGEMVQGVRESKLGKAFNAPADFMINMNSKVEGYFRGANYISQAVKDAKVNMVKRGILRWKITDDMLHGELASIAQDPAHVAKLMDKVNEFMLDYNGLGSFERGIIRRFIMPFYSWYKGIFRLAVYTLPVKYPGRLALIRNLGHIGWEQMGDMYRQAGIDPKQLPEFMQGAIPIGRDPKTGNVLLFTTRGPNPLETLLQLDLSTLSPPLKLVIERFLGMDLFKKKPFTSPDTIDLGGKRARYNPETGEFEQVTVTPSLPEHIARQFPQYTLLENLVRPYARYSTGSIFNPQPMVDKTGRPLQAKDPTLEALKYFGLNVQSLEPEDQARMSKSSKRNISTLWRQLQNQAAFGGG